MRKYKHRKNIATQATGNQNTSTIGIGNFTHKNSDGKTSDRYSRGHRILHPEDITIPHADDYIASLEKAYILADVAIRRSKIKEEIEHLAHLVGGKAEIYPELLTEVSSVIFRLKTNKTS